MIGPIYEYPLIGFEPAISLVTWWSPSRIVGNGIAGESVTADGVSSAWDVLPIASVEPAMAIETRERNSLRPVMFVSLLFELMTVS